MNDYEALENYQHLVLGAKGEKKAQKFLKKKKLKILEKNYKNKLGEIDIIAQDKKKNQIIFVEVKTKSTNFFGLPREMVDEQKQQKIEKVATLYLMQNKLMDQNIRFDVVEVLGDRIEHIEDAW